MLWRKTISAHARELLRPQNPAPGEEDLRGFEWRLLWQGCRGEEAASLEAHDGAVAALAVSPDGRFLVSAGFDNTIKLWNTGTRQLIRVLKQTGGKPAYSGARFSPDGALLAVADFSAVTIWQTSDWTERAVIPGAHSLCFLPLGGRLLTADSRGLRLWNPATWEPTVWLDAQPPAMPVSRVACSPDGSVLAVAQGQQVHLFAADTLAPLVSFPTHIEQKVDALAFSPDARWLAAGGLAGQVRVWDVAQRCLEASFTPHRSYVEGLCFSPDGRWLASGGADQFIDLWAAARSRLEQGRRIARPRPSDLGSQFYPGR